MWLEYFSHYAVLFSIALRRRAKVVIYTYIYMLRIYYLKPLHWKNLVFSQLFSGELTLKGTRLYYPGKWCVFAHKKALIQCIDVYLLELPLFRAFFFFLVAFCFKAPVKQVARLSCMLYKRVPNYNISIFASNTLCMMIISMDDNIYGLHSLPSLCAFETQVIRESGNIQLNRF